MDLKRQKNVLVCSSNATANSIVFDHGIGDTVIGLDSSFVRSLGDTIIRRNRSFCYAIVVCNTRRRAIILDHRVGGTVIRLDSSFVRSLDRARIHNAIIRLDISFCYAIVVCNTSGNAIIFDNGIGDTVVRLDIRFVCSAGDAVVRLNSSFCYAIV